MAKKLRLFCLDPRKGATGHRVCLPYSDYDRESRDFTLKSMRAAASADGGIISSCDRTQKKCHVIERPFGFERAYKYTLWYLLAATSLLYMKGNK